MRNCAPPAGRLPAAMRPLCDTITFCTMASPRPVPCALVVTNGLKMRSSDSGGMPGPLSSMRDARVRRLGRALHADHRLDAVRGAGLDAVAHQVAERLPQQHLVTHHPSELAGDVDAATLERQVGRRPLHDHPQVDRHHAQRLRLREVEEVRHHLTHRRGLLADGLDVGPIAIGQLRRIEQARIAVDGRQPVPELVREAGGQLTDARQRLLQAQLLLELHHFRQVGEETHRRLQIAFATGQRRHAHAEVRRPHVEAQLPAHDRDAGAESVGDHLRQRRDMWQQIA